MLKPILLISEIFYWNTDQPGIYEDIIERIILFKFYKGIETTVVHTARERKKLKSLCMSYDLTLLQWLTKPLLEKKLNLSDIDNIQREKAVQYVKKYIDWAADCGAFGVGIVSGADPGPEKRHIAQQAMTDSFSDIAEYIKQYEMDIIIEPLDREQHKRHVLGPVSEAVALTKKLRKINPSCYLCWDSAHMAIMNEDTRNSFLLSKDFIGEIHFANAVLDNGHGMYGDHHIPLGTPGFLNKETAAEILRAARDAGLLINDGCRIGMEVRTFQGNDPWVNERSCRSFLRNVLEKAKL